MLTLIILSTIILAICFIGFGIGVIFFNQTSDRISCGSVPDALSHTDCPSKQHGLCPVLDKSGLVRIVNRSRVSYKKHNIH